MATVEHNWYVQQFSDEDENGKSVSKFTITMCFTHPKVKYFKLALMIFKNLTQTTFKTKIGLRHA